MRFVTLLLLLCCSQAVCAEVRINEVMQSNVGGVVDDLNEFPDSWVELYNDGESAVDLDGYSVSKKKNFAKSYRLPAVQLQPHAYLLVYCDKEAVDLHTDFRLTTDKPSCLFLFRTDGTVADSVGLPAMLAPNVPYCRLPDASGVWTYCKQPTPGAANKGMGINSLVGRPLFSVAGGIKEEAFELRLELPAGAAKHAYICYTTDGSEPTSKSLRYSQPLSVGQTTVVRAKTFSPEEGDSPTETHSYLFLNRRQTLPVVSLVTDSAYFYDNELGICTKGTYGTTHPNSVPEVTVFGRANYYYGWSRPVNVEYFPVGAGAAAVNQLAETKVSGKAGRRKPMKSLVLKTGKRFGKSRFDYPFFEDKSWQEEFKSVALRNSGQDAFYTYFRDAFAQLSFARHTSIDYQSYQPVVLFLNGNYMGLRNLRERSNDDYLKANYPDLGDFDLIEGFGGTVKSGDSTAFCHFREVYTDSASTYAQLDSLMDIDEFLDYFILYVLYCNTDFPGNNVLMWKTPQTKWRWLAKDFDSAMGVVKSPNTLNYLNYILRVPPYLDRGAFNAEASCALFRKMMSFPQFSQTFIDRAAVYMGTFASVGRLNALIDSLAANIDYEMPFFAEIRTKDEMEWAYSVSALKNWVDGRIPYFYSDLSRFFEMGRLVPLKINTSGYAFFNNVPLEGGNFDGYFFAGRRIHLSAKPETDFRSDAYHSQTVVSECKGRAVSRIDECWREEEFSLPSVPNAQWTVQYVRGDSLFVEQYDDQTLDWVIPAGVTNVQIGSNVYASAGVVDASDLSFMACDFSGKVICRGRYSAVMPLLQSGKTYIVTSYRNGRKIRVWKVRRL